MSRSIKILTVVLLAQAVFDQSHLLSDQASNPDVRINHAGSALSNKIYSLTGIIDYYVRNHNGQLPNSWETLDNFYSLSNLDTYGPGSIPDNFYLVTNSPVTQVISNVHIQSPQIIAIGRSPISEMDREGLGRFVIYRLKDGSFEDAWYPEETIQKIISETHVVVPYPPPLQPSNPNDNPGTPATATNQSQPNETSATQANLSQPASTTLASLALTPQRSSTSELGIPWWIYATALLSLGLIGSLWYFLKTRK